MASSVKIWVREANIHEDKLNKKLKSRETSCSDYSALTSHNSSHRLECNWRIPVWFSTLENSCYLRLCSGAHLFLLILQPIPRLSWGDFLYWCSADKAKDHYVFFTKIDSTPCNSQGETCYAMNIEEFNYLRSLLFL